ncbi:MAG: hypothetical protein ABI411_13755 [Tahibacter sp.]
MQKTLRYLAILLFTGIGASTDAAAGDFPAACFDYARIIASSEGDSSALVQTLSLPALVASNTPASFAVGERNVSVSVRRYACNATKSILVLGFEDTDNLSGARTLLFPKLTAELGDKTEELVAFALEDGSLVSPDFVGWIGSRSSFALVPRFSSMDLNRSLRLRVTASQGAGQTATFDIPEYTPTPQTTPDAFGARVISGRYAGNYFDATRSGEGIIVEIGDFSGQPGSHFLQFSWFTYDNEGKPFWISGGGNFADGDKHLHMPAAFRGGGLFAGTKAAETLSIWGTVDIEFSDCNTLQLDYASAGKFAPNVPVGSGHLEWQRLTGISNFGCN